VQLVDSPFDLDKCLQEHINNGDKSVRLLSSYSRAWVSQHILTASHTNDDAYDFVLNDHNGKQWKKYWNNPNGYDTFVQASENTKMAEDPLCEIGCPYVVRGFDYNYLGILWLNDIVWRKGKWMINFEHTEETANKFTRARALKEHENHARSLGIRNLTIKMVEADNLQFPKTKTFFQTIKQAYRILFTRAIKGVYLYIEDKETREYVRSLLNS
jgi:DUF2075 family protein